MLYSQKEMLIITLLSLVLLASVLLLGFVMFKASRWSRKKNKELKMKHEDSSDQALNEIFEGKKGSIAKFFASSMPKSYAIFGNFLAAAVIFFFIALASLIVYSKITHR